MEERLISALSTIDTPLPLMPPYVIWSKYKVRNRAVIDSLGDRSFMVVSLYGILVMLLFNSLKRLQKQSKLSNIS